MENNVIPRHIVLFMDGNRRWAKERGLSPLEGHLEGGANVRRFAGWCRERGVEIVTAFGFSTENWNRSPEEVEGLMNLLESFLSNPEEIQAYMDQGIFIKIVGQRERLRPSLQKVIAEIEEKTAGNKKLRLNLAISYGGRWDILQAVSRMIQDGLSSEEVTEEAMEARLSMAGMPAPDLIIRPGGEQRLSNFVLWQVAYAELYFCDAYWPAFTEQDFDTALEAYAKRKRRFGR